MGKLQQELQAVSDELQDTIRELQHKYSDAKDKADADLEALANECVAAESRAVAKMESKQQAIVEKYDAKFDELMDAVGATGE